MEEQPISEIRAPSWCRMVIIAVLWLLLATLELPLTDLVGGFMLILLLLPLIVCFAISCIVLIVDLIRTIRFCIRSRIYKQILPALIAIVLFAITLLLPVSTYYENLRFAALSRDFDMAAQNVLASEEVLVSDKTYLLVSLPFPLRMLSRGGGEVLVLGEASTRVVLFYAYRGTFMEAQEYYAYAPTQQARDYLANKVWIQFTPLRENWYYCIGE